MHAGAEQASARLFAEAHHSQLDKGWFFASVALNEKGNPIFELLNSVTFTEQDGKMTVTLRARVVKASAEALQYLAGMEAGWSQSLQRLGTHLAASRGNAGA